VRDDRFVPSLPVPDATSERAEFDAMTRELVDYRLAQYRARRRAVQDCPVVDGVIELPDEGRDALPDGPTLVVLEDGTRWELEFSEHRVDAAWPEGAGDEDRLGDLLRGWFGAGVAQPDGSFTARFERAGDTWYARPLSPPPLTDRESGYASALMKAMADGVDEYARALRRHARALAALQGEDEVEAYLDAHGLELDEDALSERGGARG